jgi:SAM-dependent methyltransferase
MEPFELGKELKLFIQLPGFDTPIEISGKVVRKDNSGIGVEFRKPFKYVDELLSSKDFGTKYKGFLKAWGGKIKYLANEKLSDQNKSRVFRIQSIVRRHIGFLVTKDSGRKICPICEKEVQRFISAYYPPVPDARCPACGAVERHRLDWLFMKLRTNLLDRTKKCLLHVAPEQGIRKRFQGIEGLKYVCTDLSKPNVDIKADILWLPFKENSFDAIYCSHVLEHVPNDRKAMKEFYRVLKAGGWALLQVPISAPITFEDPKIVSPLDRARVFGRYDHVRRYGPDYADRLRDAGFKVTVFRTPDILPSEEQRRLYGISPNRTLFYCEK